MVDSSRVVWTCRLTINAVAPVDLSLVTAETTAAFGLETIGTPAFIVSELIDAAVSQVINPAESITWCGTTPHSLRAAPITK